MALWVSGSFGVVVTGLFLAVMVTAWQIEGSRWQISEVAGTTLIVLALPLFYLGWRSQLFVPTGGDTWVARLLALMILALTSIKLLQKKSDRDWIFLYLMSFFEVLLGAGLSISALYLGSFLVYLLVMVCAIIAFEIRKTARFVDDTIAGRTQKKKTLDSRSDIVLPMRRLPVTAIGLITVIVALAIPLFFILPRVGGAGLGGRSGNLKTSVGFSDTVKLGAIGRIQQSDEVVMRVKLENGRTDTGGFYFRGVALDTFDNQTWRRAKTVQKSTLEKSASGMIQVDSPTTLDHLLVQTIYLEPLDTAILFALPRAIAVQGNFDYLNKDAYGALTYQRSRERISYRVISDRGLPSSQELRQDNAGYSADFQNYLDLPDRYDLRIADLARQITSKDADRYDKARAVETYLQNNYGYTLDMKAGGPEPLADFLFNVREGHCEYFATAMAIMLRTQGIATRVVNGFHGGDYNDTADVTVVRQRNAHSWVEVYFPKNDVWVPFDPTPFAPRSGDASLSGIAMTVSKYVEALETFWIQYFVAFDNQGQHSLAKTVQRTYVNYEEGIASYVRHTQVIIQAWWSEVRGDLGQAARFTAIGYTIVYAIIAIASFFFALWLYRKIRQATIWRRLWGRIISRDQSSMVEFYEQMVAILAEKGFHRAVYQTPFEFAQATGSIEAVHLTDRYNRVRFGGKGLSREESAEIEVWLKKLREAKTAA